MSVPERLDLIGRAIDAIKAGEHAEAEIQDVRTHLIGMLDLVPRDPGVDAATDDLYSVAVSFVAGTDRSPRACRLLDQALVRLRHRLASGTAPDMVG